MHSTCCGQDDGTAGGESQADKPVSSDFQIGFSFGCNPDDATLAGERSRNVEVAISIEGQSLGTSYATVEH